MFDGGVLINVLGRLQVSNFNSIIFILCLIYNVTRQMKIYHMLMYKHLF